jgi:flagellar biosynthesis GTPase FlhF
MAFSLQMLRAVAARVNEENNSLPLALEQRKEELRRAFAACEIQENEAWIEQAFRLAQVEHVLGVDAVVLRRQMCPSKTKRSVLKGAYSFLCACLEQGIVPIQNSTQFAVLRKVPEASRIDVWKEAVDMYDADVTIEVLKSFVVQATAQPEEEETKAEDPEVVEDPEEPEEPEDPEDPEEPEESVDQEDRPKKRATSDLPERAAKRSRIEEMETFVTDIQSDEMEAFGEVCGRHWTETMKKDFKTGFWRSKDPFADFSPSE